MLATYIAGPFRASTGWGIEQNVRKAELVGLMVAKLGILPVIPHTMFRWYHGENEDQFWLNAMLELMFRTDAVLFLDDWKTSAGSLAEEIAAQQRNMPCFYLSQRGLTELARWRDQASNKPLEPVATPRQIADFGTEWKKRNVRND